MENFQKLRNIRKCVFNKFYGAPTSSFQELVELTEIIGILALSLITNLCLLSGEVNLRGLTIWPK